jgi:hypothetical protein
MLRLRVPQFSIRWLLSLIAIMALLFGGIAWAMKSRFFQSFCWLGEHAIQCNIYFFPWLTGATVAGIVVALGAAIADRRLWRIRSLWFFLPIVVPIGILCFGVAYRNPGSHDALADRRLFYLDAIFWLHVPIGIALLACFRTGWSSSASRSRRSGFLMVRTS